MSKRAGMILMLFAATCIGIQAYFVKRAAEYTGAAEIAFLRFLASYLIIQIAVSAGWIEIRLVNRRLVFARGILGGIGNLLYYYAVAATRLSNAMVLLYTYPIFASLYARWMQGTVLTARLAITLAASMVGVYLIVAPSFDRLIAGDLLGIASGMMVGGAIVSLKESRKTDSSWTIFHYFNIAGIALSLPFVIGRWALPPLESLGPISGVVFFSMLGQIGMTVAFRYTTTAEGSILSMFGAVVGSVLGIWVLSEPARPEFLLGAALVVASGIYLTVRASREP